MSEQGRASSDCSDAELLTRLRGGDSEAYTELWRRHVRAAIRVARRVYPERADDLVSEGFLAVYHQLTVSGNGPESAFRAYLFTTMRNLAFRWRKQDYLVEADPELDEIEAYDGLRAVEDRAQADQILVAFQALPERWQRVLWLTEVEEVGRANIARELGLRPNAVSALYRRAQNGLRLQWMQQQIPSALRNNPAHVAERLPQLLLAKKIDQLNGPDSIHLQRCEACRDVRQSLGSSLHTMHRTTLGVAGFAALGVVLPAAHVSVTAVGVGAAAAILFVGGAALVAGLGLFAPAVGGSETGVAAPPTGESGLTSGTDTDDGAPTGSGDSGESGEALTGGQLLGDLGRGNLDPSIPGFVFGGDGVLDDYVPPRHSTPIASGGLPAPAASPSTALRAGMVPPATDSGYLAPVIAGTATPGASVALELNRATGGSDGGAYMRQFDVPADANGDWSFDARTYFVDFPGEFTYRAWAYTAEETSSVDEGAFTILTPQITGFEELEPFVPIPLPEASTSGIVFDAAGPANGRICLISVWSGQTAEFQLDSTGHAVRRIQMLTGGSYYFAFRACDDGFRGPPTEIVFDVADPDAPGFDPFGPDPSMTQFLLTEP